MKGNYNGLNWGINLESDRMDWAKVWQISGRMAGVCSSNMTSSQVKWQILLNIINVHTTNEMHFKVYDVFYSINCYQRVAAKTCWWEFSDKNTSGTLKCLFYVHVTVHHNRFRLNDQPDALNYPNLFCYKTSGHQKPAWNLPVPNLQ
jgi:hypothetical protein